MKYVRRCVLTLNVVTKNLTVTLGTTLSETLQVENRLVHDTQDLSREALTLPPFPRPDIVF